jgi:hypothetical protein
MMARQTKYLPKPINQNQINVARKIQEQLPIWSNTDKALNALNEAYKGFGLDACLIKAASVNSLYSTYVLAISKMAGYIHELLHDKVLASITEDDAIELVEKIADLHLPSVTHDQELEPTEIRVQKPRQKRRFLALPLNSVPSL